MINQQLINPKSIVVIGASNDLKKAGGKMLDNIIQGGYSGELMVVNRRESSVQNQKSFSHISELPIVELAILAIPAKYCPEAVELLARTKHTKAFIVISAGFSELNEEGSLLEEEMNRIVQFHDACLAGPNCIGILNQNYHGVFTLPIPKLDPKGCDFISSSGATAIFLIEAGMQVGLRFSSIYSVGNGNNLGAEEYLEYLDNSFDEKTSSKIKILYLENISNPQKLQKHAVSLIKKGCRIAAIKAGSSSEGSRAAISHTGAIATSDMATRALFRKSGIVYCSSREELISTASVFTYKALTGKNIAIITHAGGSAVMLTDVLSHGGLKIPEIKGDIAEDLLSYLYPGSSVSNPIDFLATGTADQLGIIIDYCEHKLDFIDAMIVVFGSPGLFDVENVYKVLNVKMDICQKPIYPVLPSIVNAQKEIRYFLSKGHVNFPDEVILGRALTETFFTTAPIEHVVEESSIDQQAIRNCITDTENDNFLSVNAKNQILDLLTIPRVGEKIVFSQEEAINSVKNITYPIVMKVVGPIHKTDVGGVAINVTSEELVIAHFNHMMAIPGATSVLLQHYVEGIELFVGVKYEPGFGHLLMLGLGGIFVEVLKDVQVCLCPTTREEIHYLLKKLKAYPILIGIRGKKGIDIDIFVDIILKISQLTQIIPEIKELDINPLIGRGDKIAAVDMRVKIDRTLD